MKVTLDSIKAKIKDEAYLVLPDGRTTLCVLTMENSFTITGTSACVDPSEFNINLGRKYAFEDALRQIFTVEAYLLCQKMHEENLKAKDPVVAAVKQKQEEVMMKAEMNRTAYAPWGRKMDGTPKAKPGRKKA
jgi:outer membrane lipopolysaccharide assembly protein LptE/RlpB